jgi:hypothetical protein
MKLKIDISDLKYVDLPSMCLYVTFQSLKPVGLAGKSNDKKSDQGPGL